MPRETSGRVEVVRWNCRLGLFACLLGRAEARRHIHRSGIDKFYRQHRLFSFEAGRAHANGKSVDLKTAFAGHIKMPPFVNKDGDAK